MGPRRIALALVAMLAVLGLATGLVSGFFGAATAQGLRATGVWTDGGAPTLPPGTFDRLPSAVAEPPPVPADLPPAVLTAETEHRVPAAARLAARLAAVDPEPMGGRFSAQVADLTSGKVLYARRAGSPAIPASTTKLLTSTAALSLLGPQHVFATDVVRGGRGRIVLVGGGDPYLSGRAPVAGAAPTGASLPALAAATATALRRAGTTEVALGYDASLFAGPAWNPSWPPGYAEQVTPVSALWVDRGRTAGVSPGPRAQDPAREAARAFARALEKEGVEVTRTTETKAPASAKRLARVTSLPLDRIVERLLLVSDNDTAEVLLRQVALAAGKRGSSAEGTKAVSRTLDTLVGWPAGARVQDGSGLARQSKVPADTLVDVVRLAADPEHPELRAVLTGLPVAGVEGSLRHRYVDQAARAGRGLVRGKTGTLTGVHALAGYVRTADGAQLAYAFVVNDATDDAAARVWLDRVSTAVSRCGC